MGKIESLCLPVGPDLGLFTRGGGETAAAGTKVRKKCTSSSQVALASYIGQLMHSLMHILDCSYVKLSSGIVHTGVWWDNSLSFEEQLIHRRLTGVTKAQR